MTTLAWDWASGIPEMLSDGDNLYLVGHDTLARWDGSEWAYHLPDALGSVRQVVDGAGSVVGSREWTPYGVELALSGVEGVGTAQAGLGFAGEWWDGDAGLLYLRARWYVPEVGRFTRRDPWPGNYRQPLTMNPYLYALANPILLDDPSGYGPEDTIGFAEDTIRKWAVLWYREYYLRSITRYSQEFSIDRVELEAGLYTMGGGEGFVSDVLRKRAGFRQDIAWDYITLGLAIFGCMPSPLQRKFLEAATRAAVPSLGIAQVDPPTAIAIENYWARQGVDLYPFTGLC